MGGTARGNRVSFGPFELVLNTRELRKNGCTVPLQPQSFAALAKLLECAGEVVTRESLRGEIWPSGTFVDFDTGLNAVMRRLRQALGDDAEYPRFIETLPRIGYRFIAPVRSVADEIVADPQTNVTSPPGAVAALATGRRRNHLLAGMAVTPVIVLLLIATVTVRQHRVQSQRAYKMGLYELGRWTPDDLRRSVNYFEQAVRLDEANAAAWAGLARSYTLLAALQLAPADAEMTKAKAAALKALDCDPTVSEAHAAMAGVLMSEWSWTAADAELRRALSLNDRNSDAHQLYGYWLLAQARPLEGVAEMRRAEELDPDSPNKRNSLAVALFYARDYDDALVLWSSTPAVEANSIRRHLRLAFIYEAKSMRSDSIAEMLAALRSSGSTAAADQVERTYVSGGYDAARQAFYRTELEVESATHSNNFEIAVDYAALDEKERALEALKRSVALRETGVTYLAVDPRFESLRSDTRFLAVLRTAGVGVGRTLSEGAPAVHPVLSPAK